MGVFLQRLQKSSFILTFPGHISLWLAKTLADDDLPRVWTCPACTYIRMNIDFRSGQRENRATGSSCDIFWGRQRC